MLGRLPSPEDFNMPKEAYSMISQRIEDETQRSDREQLQPKNGFLASNPLLSLASLGFAFSTISCIALAVVVSKINSPGLESGNDYDLESLSSHDCSRIEAIGAAEIYTQRLMNFAIYDKENGSVSQFEQTFSIDIKSQPSLTFVQVKVIDVMWNLIAGQGLRFLMAYITYVVCSKATILLVNRWRVSYDFYVSVGFEGTSLMSIFQAGKELAFHPTRRSIRDKLIIFWIILGMVYTISIPSLLSAATGYMTPTESWWQMPDQSLVSNLTESTRACWLVQDGTRIGLDNNTYISGPYFHPFLYDSPSYTDGTTCRNLTSDFPMFDSLTQYYCGLMDLFHDSYASSKNETNSGVIAAQIYTNTSTTIVVNNTSIDVPAPPLELGEGQPTDVYNGTWIPHIRQCYNGRELYFDSPPPMVCVSGPDKYSWGFSRKLSYAILIVQGTWCFSTWLMWLYVTKICQNLKRETPGPFKTALALTDAMQADLGDKARSYTEKELAEELGKQSGLSAARLRDIQDAELYGLRRR